MFSWILAVLLVLAIILALELYLRLKPIANGVLAISVKEFTEACESLLETPEDLPDPVLSSIADMYQTAFERNAPWKLLKIMGMMRKNVSLGAAHAPLSVELVKMRPQLQELMYTACASWVNILGARSLFVGLLLKIEEYRGQVARGKMDKDMARTALDIVPEIHSSACC